MSWNDPSGSGFHSQGEKDSNRQLRDQIDSLAKNYNGGDAWGDAGNYASGRSSGKYSDKLMNDDHLNHMIGYLSSRQKQAQAPAPPKAAPTPPPVEHSPEIQQAKERVRTYENDVLSGKTSEDIYKTGSNDKYGFDGTQGASGIGSPMKGAAGIGTPMNGGSQEQADKATASFLDNKKSQVKDQYQFKVQR